VAVTKRWQHNFTFGGRVPWAIGLVIALTASLSILAAISERNLSSLFALAALVPDAVLHGQLWRLLTWTFFEPSPWGLIMSCLMLYWFGRDLAAVWGSRRFLAVFGGVVLTAAVGTCLIALVDSDVREQTFLGSWTLGIAMTVCWGLWFPNRTVNIYFFFPIRGVWLAWGTVGLTVLYSAYAGWARFLPEFVAETAVLLWFYRSWLQRWARARGWFRGPHPLAGGGSWRKRSRRPVAVDYLRTVDDTEPSDHGPN
jgi:membrane associated rhomboid family serine protease